MENEIDKKICGIVMPISSIDGCSEAHWSDVLDILNEAIESAGFEPNLVSNADDVGIIQKRIIQNLYSNSIVVCDVSGKNPNVMLELGMRLAFDRPVVIIKDDKTTYSFDTSPIEHLNYPRDLRFSKIVEFKRDLKSKILKTVEASEADTSYSPFLGHFGKFTVAKIDTTEVSSDKFIIDELRSLRRQISRIGSRPFSRRASLLEDPDFDYDIHIKINSIEDTTFGFLQDRLLKLRGIDGLKALASEYPEYLHIQLSTSRPFTRHELEALVSKAFPGSIFRVRTIWGSNQSMEEND